VVFLAAVSAEMAGFVAACAVPLLDVIVQLLLYFVADRFAVDLVSKVGATECSREIARVLVRGALGEVPPPFV